MIVLQSGIDHLRLGMSPERVVALVGAPQRKSLSTESESGKPIREWAYTKRKLTVSFRTIHGRVQLAEVGTRSPRERTRSGVGVGSSETAVRRGLKGEDCADTGGAVWCTIGGDRLGSRQTIFELRRGRVTQVRILVTFP